MVYNQNEADNELTWAAEEEVPTDGSYELVGNPYMFTGRRFDIETGLYYYRARYYNPYIGRFMQTDPVGYNDGMNWYSYCSNNPVNCFDPTGLWKIAFYDGSQPQFLESADDFDAWYDLTKYKEEGYSSIIDYMRSIIADCCDVLTDIYFFGHSDTESSNWNDWAFNLGTWQINPGTVTYNNFCNMLRETTKPDCSIHFRQCSIAKADPNNPYSRPLLEDLALKIGREVTGCEAPVVNVYGWLYPFYYNPDYYFKGAVWKANTSGGVVYTEILWAPIWTVLDYKTITIMVPGRGGWKQKEIKIPIWGNPYGDHQPY